MPPDGKSRSLKSHDKGGDTVKEFKAYAPEHTKGQLLTLQRAIVQCTVRRDDRIEAIAKTPWGKEVTFWINTPDSETGARRKVEAQSGRDYPVVTFELSSFPIEEGTEILYVPRRGPGRVFPVVSLHYYKLASRKLNSTEYRTDKVEVIGYTKGHRFVN